MRTRTKCHLTREDKEILTIDLPKIQKKERDLIEKVDTSKFLEINRIKELKYDL